MMEAKIPRLIQLLFGLVILGAGINKLYLWMPVPEQTRAGQEFIDFLYATGYLMYVVALTEIVGGSLLLLNRSVPFTLLLLAPVTFNILLFHIFLEQKGLLMGLSVFSLQLILLLIHRKKFSPLFGKEAGAPKKEKPAAEAPLTSGQAPVRH